MSAMTWLQASVTPLGISSPAEGVTMVSLQI